MAGLRPLIIWAISRFSGFFILMLVFIFSHAYQLLPQLSRLQHHKVEVDWFQICHLWCRPKVEFCFEGFFYRKLIRHKTMMNDCDIYVITLCPSSVLFSHFTTTDSNSRSPSNELHLTKLVLLFSSWPKQEGKIIETWWSKRDPLLFLEDSWVSIFSKFPGSLSNHVGFIPWIFYSSPPHSSEGITQLKTG